MNDKQTGTDQVDKSRAQRRQEHRKDNKPPAASDRCQECGCVRGDEGPHLHPSACVKVLRKHLQHQSVGLDTAAINYGQQLERMQAKMGNLRDALALMMMRHVKPEQDNERVRKISLSPEEIKAMPEKCVIAFETHADGKSVVVRLTVPGVDSGLPS